MGNLRVYVAARVVVGLCYVVYVCATCALIAWIGLIVMRFELVSGRLAQMVERPLRMREVGGSIPPVSTLYSNNRPVFTHA